MFVANSQKAMTLLEPLEEQPLITSDCVKKVSHSFETLVCASPDQIFSALCLSLQGAIPGENLVGEWNCNFPAMAVGLTAELGAAFYRFGLPFGKKSGLRYHILANRVVGGRRTMKPGGRS